MFLTATARPTEAALGEHGRESEEVGIEGWKKPPVLQDPTPNALTPSSLLIHIISLHWTLTLCGWVLGMQRDKAACLTHWKEADESKGRWNTICDEGYAGLVQGL